MTRLMGVGVVAIMLAGMLHGQEPAKPALRKGVSVQMPVARQAVEMRAADGADAVVVAIGAGGEIYLGTERIEAAGLSHLAAQLIYVKADARVPFQTVLTVLEALRGKKVGLLSAAPESAKRGGMVWPYGIYLAMDR